MRPPADSHLCNRCPRNAIGLRARTSGRWWRDRIRGIGPVHSRQVMQCDARAPAIRSRPERPMRAHDAEIDQDNHRANWQSIADDGEGPRVTGIACEDQPAHGTAIKERPPGKQSPLAAVRAALAQAAPERRQDQFRAGRPLATIANRMAANPKCRIEHLRAAHNSRTTSAPQR
jgi:hypothetical protein